MDEQRSMQSAYANPQPYGSVTLERHALEGRLKVARGIADRARADGDLRTAARWNASVDALLDHLGALEVRVASAVMDQQREAPASAASPDNPQ